MKNAIYCLKTMWNVGTCHLSYSQSMSHCLRNSWNNVWLYVQHPCVFTQKCSMATNKKNYYELLGISPDAKQEDIKDAYIRLTKVHHPDKQKFSEASPDDFMQVKEAYDVLKSPVRRAEYDLTEFVRSSNINRFASGEYRLYREQVKGEKDPRQTTSTPNQSRSTSANAESAGTWSNPFSVSPRVRQLLSYLYFAIATTGVLMLVLNRRKRNAVDSTPEERDK